MNLIRVLTRFVLEILLAPLIRGILDLVRL